MRNPRFYLPYFLILWLQGLAQVTGLFFSQQTYQRNLTTAHSTAEPVLRIYAFDQWARETVMTCEIVSVNMTSHPPGPSAIVSEDIFSLAVNYSEVSIYMEKPSTKPEIPDPLRYKLRIQCTTPEPSFFSKFPDVSLSSTTSVTLNVYSAENGHQASPCKVGALRPQEVCFADFTDHVIIRENMMGFVATQWQGSVLAGCGAISKTYSVNDSVSHLDDAGYLHILSPLDYEDKHLREVNLQVTCEVDGHTPVTHHFKLTAVNINDLHPSFRKSQKTINNPTAARNGSIQVVAFEGDGDDLARFIQVSIENDTAGQFTFTKKYFSFHDSGAIMIHLLYAHDFMLEGPVYEFDVVMRDYGYLGDNNTDTYHQVSQRITLNLPSFGIINADAAAFSRVLISEKKIEGERFRLSWNQPNHRSLPVDITPNEGIIYVNNTALLRRLANSKMNIGIRYIKANMEIQLNTTIHVTGSSGNDTCEGVCSAMADELSCTSTCGLGTSSGGCSWRTGCDDQSLRDQYCTCTPHLNTCPDAICDELEAMVPELCPLDCTDVGRKRNTLASDNSVCWCPTLEDCECFVKPAHTDNFTHPPFPPAVRTASTGDPCGPVCLTLTLAGTLAVTIAMAIAIMLVYKNCRYQVSKENKEKPLGGSVASLSAAAPSDYVDSGEQRMSSGASQVSLERPQWGFSPPSVPMDPKWEVPRKNIKLDKTLGEGEFGRVVRAEAFDIDKSGETKTVAVKMLKELATGSELRDLLSEYNLLKDVGHQNVIKLLGVCSKGGPFYLIVEYCEFGALRSFLRDCRFNESFYLDQQRAVPTEENIEGGGGEAEKCVSSNDLLSFAWQIVKGMQYLSSMKLVHRDLAARNVLVASGKVIKISDFGLSRDIYEEDTYLKRSKGRIPVKWMAPESLYEQIYTTKSDVWSFGITLWEIVTLGATPYPGLAPERLYHRLKSGYRMDKPTHCSDQLFRVMSWCWRTLPGDRPTFTQLAETLEAMLKQNVEYLDLGGAIDRHPILEDDNMVIEEQQNDQETGYGSISRLTEDNAYLNPASHGPHDFDEVICDDCTMRMIKEGDVTTECTKLLNCDNDSMNNNNSGNNPNNKSPGGTGGGGGGTGGVEGEGGGGGGGGGGGNGTGGNGNGTRPLLYIQLQHENSDEEHEHIPPPQVEVV